MIILLSILATYILIMLFFWIGFERVPIIQLSSKKKNTSFSVIIPFRNESEHLPQLLTSFSRLEYPAENVEFIFVNDDSTDNSCDLIRSYSEADHPYTFQVIDTIRTSSSPKKDAITTAINIAKHEWIITTDADCIVPSTWLWAYDALIQKQPLEMVIGPVRYDTKSSFLHTIQYVEFHSLQAVTIGSFGLKKAMMCNGANLGYTKSAFFNVKGFEDNNSIASGDDVFLFEKIYASDKEKVGFLHTNAAVVTTQPENEWSAFINQRIRWASKSTHYKSTFTQFIGVVVLLANLAMIVSIFSYVLGGIQWQFLLMVLLPKMAIDIILCLRFSSFYDPKNIAKNYLVAGIVYPFLSSYIGCKALFSGYTWKERSFTK